MKITPSAVPEVLLIEPTVHRDARGFLFESFHQSRFDEAVGRRVVFVQENHTLSARNVLRGLHYQVGRPQEKLVRVVTGEILDVAVDIRRSSPTFRAWVAEKLSAENRRQMWIPAGFAHGFVVLSECAEVLYKASDYWARECERAIAWNDPTLAIDWGVAAQPILSGADRRAPRFCAAELFA